VTLRCLSREQSIRKLRSVDLIIVGVIFIALIFLIVVFFLVL
jgi:hypothetical protein